MTPSERWERLTDIKVHIGDPNADSYLISKIPFLLSELERLEAENAEHQAERVRWNDYAKNWVSIDERIKEIQSLKKENAELRAFKETLKNHLPQCSGDKIVDLGLENERLKKMASQWQQAAMSLQSRLDKAVKALDWAMPYLEDLYGDFYSAKWLPGSGLNNRAGYKLLHDKAGLEKAREALAEIKGEK